MIYVNGYDKSQCYGGPEEGGLYYDRWHSGYIIKTFKTEKEAIAFRRSEACQKIMNGVPQNTEYHMGNNSMDGCSPDGEADDSYLQRGGAWGTDKVYVRIESHKPKSGDNYAPYC